MVSGVQAVACSQYVLWVVYALARGAAMVRRWYLMDEAAVGSVAMTDEHEAPERCNERMVGNANRKGAGRQLARLGICK